MSIHYHRNYHSKHSFHMSSHHFFLFADASPSTDVLSSLLSSSRLVLLGCMLLPLRQHCLSSRPLME
jgi:hypothetical protein